MAEWISVKDELPEVGAEVLGYSEKKKIGFLSLLIVILTDVSFRGNFRMMI